MEHFSENSTIQGILLESQVAIGDHLDKSNHAENKPVVNNERLICIYIIISFFQILSLLLKACCATSIIYATENVTNMHEAMNQDNHKYIIITKEENI